jgi:hypothetical protein
MRYTLYSNLSDEELLTAAEAMRRNNDVLEEVCQRFEKMLDKKAVKKQAKARKEDSND